MSTWHDVVSCQPEAGQLVCVRRSPGDCPPFAANWDATNAQFLCGPEQWTIPWQFVSHWRPLACALAWPQPRSGASPWQDIYTCPPANGQSVWLRRCGEDSAAFRARFDRLSLTFTLPSGWQIRWYEVCKWRAG
jgi:hypothetical protein